MKIISISGIDGSGKSTQLKMLKKYLTERNKKVESFHSVSFSLINSFLKKKKEASIEKIKEETNEHPDQAIMFDQGCYLRKFLNHSGQKDNFNH